MNKATFNLPDLANRFLEGNGYGYVEAGLPNITGTVGSMCDAGNSRDSGALSWASNSNQSLGYNSYGISGTTTFNASK